MSERVFSFFPFPPTPPNWHLCVPVHYVNEVCELIVRRVREQCSRSRPWWGGQRHGHRVGYAGTHRDQLPRHRRHPLHGAQGKTGGRGGQGDDGGPGWENQDVLGDAGGRGAKQGPGGAARQRTVGGAVFSRTFSLNLRLDRGKYVLFIGG